MWERVKTAVLSILVALSAALSWMLWDAAPETLPLEGETYVPTASIGEKRGLFDVVTPVEVVFHHGDGTHTAAYPGTPIHGVIAVRFREWTFQGFVPEPYTRTVWEAYARRGTGLELVFGGEIPVTLLQPLGVDREALAPIHPTVRRIVVYRDGKGGLRAYWVSDALGKAVAARPNLTTQTLDAYLKMGRASLRVEAMPIASPNERDGLARVLYVPADPPRVRKFRYEYRTIPDRAFVQSLFVNPRLIRSGREADGRMVYTDGHRTVQMAGKDYLLDYYDRTVQMTPVKQPDGLSMAVQFVNRHGGWTGSFALARLTQGEDGRQRVRFREYLNGYPLVGPEGRDVGRMELEVWGGGVRVYTRSTVCLERYVGHEATALPHVADVLRQLAAWHIPTRDIERLSLAYLCRYRETFVDLTPVWLLERTTGEMLLIGQEAETRRGHHGLE